MIYTIQVLYEDTLFASNDRRCFKLFSIILLYACLVVVSNDHCTFGFPPHRYNTFCGYPPEIVKKMPKKELAEEVMTILIIYIDISLWWSILMSMHMDGHELG